MKKRYTKLTDAMFDERLSPEFHAYLEQTILEILTEGNIEDTPRHRELIMQGYWVSLLKKAKGHIPEEKRIAMMAKLDQEMAETDEQKE